MVKRICVCVGVGGRVRREEEETCERGKKRQRMLNVCVGGGVRREEEEAWERGKKRQRILNELIDYSSFKILPVDIKIPRDLGIPKHKLEGNIYFGCKELADDLRRRFSRLNKNHRNRVIKTPHVANEEKSCGDQSPEKALRAAMLKTRFADTIFKATQTLSNELERRRQRQRKALDDMEKAAADRVDNTTADLKTLFGATGYPSSEVLKRLGLCIKEDEDEDEEVKEEEFCPRKKQRKELEDMEKAAAASVDNTARALKALFGATGYPNSRVLKRLGLFIKEEERGELDEYSFSYSGVFSH